MDAAQAGMLAGIRPMIEYLATPFWNKIANRFQKGKMMLLIAVASWIIFTLPIGFIHPPGMHTRPAKIIWWIWFQTPFNFLGQKESTCQILGHLAAIKVCH